MLIWILYDTIKICDLYAYDYTGIDISGDDHDIEFSYVSKARGFFAIKIL